MTPVNVTVKLLPPTNIVKGKYQYELETKTRQSKETEGVPRNQVKGLFRDLGLLEGYINQLAATKIRGNLLVTIVDRNYQIGGNLFTYHSDEKQYTNVLLKNMVRVLEKISGINTGSIIVMFSIEQKIKYHPK